MTTVITDLAQVIDSSHNHSPEETGRAVPDVTNSFALEAADNGYHSFSAGCVLLSHSRRTFYRPPHRDLRKGSHLWSRQGESQLGDPEFESENMD